VTRFQTLADRYAEFVAERDWGRFHTPQNLAAAIAVEAGELQETFLWHDNVGADRIRQDSETMTAVEEELADVVIYCIGLANVLDIDLLGAVERKLEANERRYDEETAAEVTRELGRWQRD
jgi:NTP pyrophosphatase (non-canonical NTP hydrolase)